MGSEVKAVILEGDCVASMREIPALSVDCVVTSPPYYGLRDYGSDGQIGLEKSPEEYVKRMVEVFREVRRILKDTGTVWLNLGDSYAGSGKGGQSSSKRSKNWSPSYAHHGKVSDGFKPKDLIGIPWRVALALQADGWWLRQEVIWDKPNAMPEPVKDRCVRSHEHIFLLSKSSRYFFDYEAVKESTSDGKGKRNRRSVWRVNTKPLKQAHFAVFPIELIEPCILAGTSEHGNCADCGAPWERLLSKEQGERNQQTRPKDSVLDSKGTPTDRNGSRNAGLYFKNYPTTTVGWEPTCECNAEVVPATVFDPFGGSGTTAIAAIQAGRNAILCELNPKYISIAQNRIAQEALSEVAGNEAQWL
tara:strand:+ start:4471 stop:5553 length:1083 start_codon:yes stop_codon:yes gene_type:complete